MTTATKTASAELARLEQRREKTHAAVQKIKRDRNAYDDETQQRRAELGARQSSHPEEFEGAQKKVKPDTGSAELQAEIRRRMSEDNPHHADYEQALAEFHAADSAVTAFRNAHVQELIAEGDPDADHAIDAIRAPGEQLLDACNQYRGRTNGVRSVVSTTPALARKPGMFTEDPRVEQWARMANEIVDADIAKPGLSETAAQRLSDLGA